MFIDFFFFLIEPKLYSYLGVILTDHAFTYIYVYFLQHFSDILCKVTYQS